MKVAIHSNIGKRRVSNQDYADYFVNDQGQPLFILCDGVGGNQAGEVASRLTTEYIGKTFKEQKSLTKDTVEAWVDKVIKDANAYIYLESTKDYRYEGMCTTLVMSLVVDQRIYIAHVGDSRAYSFQQNQLKQLTEDHSLVNELIKSGEITKEEGENHPIRHVVTQSIGGTKSVFYEASSVEVSDLECLLLCSDGLTNMVPHDKLLESFHASYDDLTDFALDLIEQANQAGGLDNITVVLLSDLDIPQIEEVSTDD